ncbi:MAG: hypothetical protein DSY40_03705 [Nautilia sp.]|nr:MAG: hypothetical protein DSY40_03705 [Nautilia sp.]
MKKILILMPILAFSNILFDASKKYSEGNFTESLKLFKQACDKKILGACYNLGEFYFNGRVVELNFTKAKIYFKKSCENGFILVVKNINF